MFLNDIIEIWLVVHRLFLNSWDFFSLLITIPFPPKIEFSTKKNGSSLAFSLRLP